jgi:hypothetical protein
VQPQSAQLVQVCCEFCDDAVIQLSTQPLIRLEHLFTQVFSDTQPLSLEQAFCCVEHSLLLEVAKQVWHAELTFGFAKSASVIEPLPASIMSPPPPPQAVANAIITSVRGKCMGGALPESRRENQPGVGCSGTADSAAQESQP